MNKLDRKSLQEAMDRAIEEANQHSNQENTQSEPPNAIPLYSDEGLIKSIDAKDRLEWVKLRTKYANKIYRLLFVEIVFICLIIVIDGLCLFSCRINEWLLGSVFYGVLTHTFFLVRIIVKNLFTR